MPSSRRMSEHVRGVKLHQIVSGIRKSTTLNAPHSGASSCCPWSRKQRCSPRGKTSHTCAVVPELEREACLGDRRTKYDVRARTHTYCEILVSSARPSPRRIKTMMPQNWHRCVIRRIGGHVNRLVRCRWLSMSHVGESDEHQLNFFPTSSILVMLPIPGSSLAIRTQSISPNEWSRCACFGNAAQYSIKAKLHAMV